MGTKARLIGPGLVEGGHGKSFGMRWFSRSLPPRQFHEVKVPSCCLGGFAVLVRGFVNHPGTQGSWLQLGNENKGTAALPARPLQSGFFPDLLSGRPLGEGE